MKLTFELTRGTKTFYLPLARDAETQPEVTLMIRRTEDGIYQAGTAICSRTDAFQKRRGRHIAYHRLQGKPLVALEPLSLVKMLAVIFEGVNKRRPQTVSPQTLEDLFDVAEVLERKFTELAERQAPAQERAQASA